MNKEQILKFGIALLLLSIAFILIAGRGCPFKKDDDDDVVTGSSAPLPVQVTSSGPADGASDVPITTSLSWTAASRATSYNVRFGTVSPPPYQTNTTNTIYNPGVLTYTNTYYWRIDSKNNNGTTTGNVWSFQTENAPLAPPAQVVSPDPADTATNVPITTTLTWAAANGATSYDVYFDTVGAPAYVTNTTSTIYDPGTLSYSATYYWRVDSKNTDGTTTGNIWSFQTSPPPNFILAGLINNDYHDAKFWLGKYATDKDTPESEWAKTVLLPGWNDTPQGFIRDDLDNLYVINSGFLAKYNSAGQLLWKHLLAASLKEIKIVDNYLYLGGSRSLSGSFSDIWLAKYDLAGTFQWELTKNGTDNMTDSFTALTVDGSGTVYVLGQVKNTGTSYDIWLGKTDGSAWQWDLSKDGTANDSDSPTTLAVDGSGNAYALGKVNNAGANTDIWLGKTTDGLSWEWDFIKNGTANGYDTPTALVVDGSENAYVLGQVNNTGTGTDIWLGKTITGTLWNWDIAKNGPANDSDSPTALAVDGSGNAYVLGKTYAIGGPWEDIWLGKTITGTYWNWDLTRNGNSGVYDKPTALSVDTSGNAYVLGLLENGSLGTGYDIWLGKTITGTLWNWDLIKSGPASGNGDHPTALAVDASGNAYVIGGVDNTEPFRDIWLGKTIDGMTWQWDISKTGTATTPSNQSTALLIDTSGNAYVLGQVDNLGTNRDIWLGKSTDGATWAWQIEMEKRADSSFRITSDSTGNIYLAATILQAAPITKEIIWVAKFTNTLSPLWELTNADLGYSSSQVESIAVDDVSGNLYVLGQVYNTDTKDDIWLGKTDGSDWQWDLIKNGAPNGPDSPKVLSVDASGNAYVLGLLYREPSPDPDGYDLWLGKTTNGTTWGWNLVKEGPVNYYNPTFLSVNTTGNAYVLGNIYNTAANNYDIWLGKANNGIDWQWSITKNGTANDDDYASCLSIDDSDNVYVVGRINNGLPDPDLWLGKTTNGITWEWNLTKVGNYFASGLLLDDSGNVYVRGSIYYQGATGSDIWLDKTDGVDWQWNITKTGTANKSYDNSCACARDNSGNIYILGIIKQTPEEGSTNIWFAKYDATGTLQYEVQKDGFNLDDQARNFALDTSGNAYVFGYLRSRERGSDIWLAKYGPSGGAPAWEIIKSGAENDRISGLIPLQSGWILGK